MTRQLGNSRAMQFGTTQNVWHRISLWFETDITIYEITWIADAFKLKWQQTRIKWGLLYGEHTQKIAKHDGIFFWHSNSLSLRVCVCTYLSPFQGIHCIENAIRELVHKNAILSYSSGETVCLVVRFFSSLL